MRLKTDVYSFGVVLYEIITGRRTIERNKPATAVQKKNKPATERRLLEWIKEYPADSQHFSMIIDPRLRNNYLADGARSLAKLADLCLKKNKKRPTMDNVVERLKKIVEEGDSGDSSVSTSKESSQVRSNIRGQDLWRRV
ncbi:putative receptor-like protein kinase [Raphanus sativus]|nr:putative receptor-like protein kinase [Raphanus sativus]